MFGSDNNNAKQEMKENNQDEILLEALRSYYLLKESNTIKEGTFAASLSFNFLKSMLDKNYKPKSEIVNNLYLGQLPTIATAEELCKEFGEKFKLVISAVDYFELAGKGTFQNIQTPALWKEKGVNHHLLQMSDFTAEVANILLYKTIEKMHEAIKRDEIVYVHCKAGRARSALVIVCYLWAYHPDIYQNKKDIDEKVQAIIDFLKSQRKQVDIKPEKKSQTKANKLQKLQKFQKIKEFITYYEQMKVAAVKNIQPEASATMQEGKQELINSNISNTEQLKHAVHEYLASAEAKEAIAQCAYIKELHFYANQKGLASQESKHIQAFLNQIYGATNASWFIELTEGRGPLSKWLGTTQATALTSLTQEQIRRGRIKISLEQEIYKLLHTKFPAFQYSVITPPKEEVKSGQSQMKS